MRRSVPVGRRHLFSEKRRTFLGVAGVAAALLMVLVLDGIFASVMRQITRYIDTADADLFVSQRGVRTMHMSSSAIDLAQADRVRTMDGVAWAEPVLYVSDSLRTTNQQLAYIVGYIPGRQGGPQFLEEGDEPGPGDLVIDERSAATLDIWIGDSVSALGRSWSVSGISSPMTNIVSTTAFVAFDDFAEAAGAAKTATFVLVGAADAPAEVARRIEDATGLTAQTRQTFSDQERQAVQDMSTELIQIMTFAAFLIGLCVVGLTLYSAVLSRLREIGIMKALGASRQKLVGLVATQAGWTVGLGLALSMAIALLISTSLSLLNTNVSVLVEPGSAIRTAIGALLLGTIGALTPLFKVFRVDAATVFRR